MAIARTRMLQWSLVWPLSRQEKAQRIAFEIAELGELRNRGVEDYHIGFVRLLLFPQESDTGRYVNIRPVHFGGMDAKVFDFSQVIWIEFEYCPEGVTEDTKLRHPWDPSTYLRIKNVR